MEFLLANKGSLLFAAGVGMVVFFLMRFWNRRYVSPIVREPSESPLARRARQATQPQPLSDAPADISRWQIEMQELARDLKGELDTKIAILQRLTLDAHAAADRLEAIVKQAERARGSSDGQR